MQKKITISNEGRSTGQAMWHVGRQNSKARQQKRDFYAFYYLFIYLNGQNGIFIHLFYMWECG